MAGSRPAMTSVKGGARAIPNRTVRIAIMDKTKLENLRRRYADAKGGALYDPEFKRVSQSQFQGDRRKWPFMDPATLLGAPYRPHAAAERFAELDIALVGVPMDLGVTN